MGVGVVVCGGKKICRKAELCEVRYKVHLTTCSLWFSSSSRAALNLLVSSQECAFHIFLSTTAALFFFPFNFKSLQSSLSYLVWQLIQFQQLKAEFPVFSWLALTGLFLGVMNPTERSRTRSRFFIN